MTVTIPVNSPANATYPISYGAGSAGFYNNGVTIVGDTATIPATGVWSIVPSLFIDNPRTNTSQIIQSYDLVITVNGVAYRDFRETNYDDVTGRAADVTYAWNARLEANDQLQIILRIGNALSGAGEQADIQSVLSIQLLAIP